MAKKKKEFSDFRVFVTLTLVCLCAAGVLALVHKLTKKPIEEARERARREALKVVLPPETENIETQIIKKGEQEHEIQVAKDASRNIVGYAVTATTNEGYGGDIVFLIGLDANGKINTYKVMQHSETPGLGDNITTQDFKNQFEGKNSENFTFKVSKDGGDVQAITAATISSRAACDALRKGLELFNEYQQGR